MSLVLRGWPFWKRLSCIWKRQCWSKIKIRKQNGASLSIMTFGSRSISCSSPQTHLSGTALSQKTHRCCPGWGHMTCRVISHNLGWRRWASGQKHRPHRSMINRRVLTAVLIGTEAKSWYQLLYKGKWHFLSISH